MARHNLSTVVSFEIGRTLSKRRFWITTLIVPVIIGIVVALIVAANSSTDSSVASQKDQKFSFSYTDASGIVDPALVQKLGGREAASPTAAIAAVKNGTLDAYFSYPADPAKQATEVYGVDTGVFDNGKYKSVATHPRLVSRAARSSASAAVPSSLPRPVTRCIRIRITVVCRRQ